MIQNEVCKMLGDSSIMEEKKVECGGGHKTLGIAIATFVWGTASPSQVTAEGQVCVAGGEEQIDTTTGGKT